MNVRVRLVISGLVQGVGFRWYVARHAQTLQLRGYVKNLAEGNVHVEAEGDRGLVEELIKQARIGPRASHVTDVKVEWLDPAKNFPPQFEIR